MVRTAAPVSAGIAASVTTCPSNEPSRCTCRGQAADSEDEPVPLPSRVAYPRWRGHVLAMQGGAFVVPWPRFAWQCHPTTCRPPPSSSRPEGRRPAVEGPVQTALPQGTRRHAAACSPMGVNVDLRPLNATPQPPDAQRHPATASAVSLRDAEKRVPRFAVLRSAPHRVTRNDDDRATRSGSRDGISTLGPTNSAGWHAHARVGMSWRCRGAFVGPWPRFAWPCHPTDL